MTPAQPKPLESVRGVKLRDALLARFRPGEPHLHVLVSRPGQDPITRTITRESVKALVSEPDRWPDLFKLETYAVAAGWTFEKVVADLGQYRPLRRRRDFGGLLARHRALLRSNLTSIERTPLPVTGAARFRIPIATDAAQPFACGALDDWLFAGDEEPAEAVALASPAPRLSARAGDCENMAYPRVPARAWLRVDRRDTRVEPGILYVLHHAVTGVVSVCTAHDDGKTMTLLPDPGSGYLAQRVARESVIVVGRVVAMAAQVGRRLPPSPPSDLLTPSMWQGDVENLASHPAKQLLTDAWRRHGRSYSEHARRTHNRRKLVFGRRRGGQSGANMHAYTADKPSRVPRPHFETLYQQSAESDVDPRELLRAFGIACDPLAGRAPSEGVTPRVEAIDRLRAHEFGAYLESLGWDLPWLCALQAELELEQRLEQAWREAQRGDDRPGDDPRGDGQRTGRGGDERSRIYHLGALVPGWAPLLKPGAFVVVDESARARRIPRAVPPAWRDWERPLHLLRTKTGPRLLCGYCEMVDGDVIRAVPHPDDEQDLVRELKVGRDALVIGRVTHVATLL